MRRLISVSAGIGIIGILLTGCASSANVDQPRVVESSPDRLTSAEIQAVGGAQTAYDLVTRLRPRWLRAGGTSSIGGGKITSQVLLIYLNGNRLGTAETLRTLTASGIKSMQYYDAVRASTILREIGSEAISGAIVITSN